MKGAFIEAVDLVSPFIEEGPTGAMELVSGLRNSQHGFPGCWFCGDQCVVPPAW